MAAIKKSMRPKTAEEFVSQASTVLAEKGKAGRPPVYDEARKVKGFNLPLSLIEEVNEVAKREFAGNASVLATEALQNFLEKYR